MRVPPACVANIVVGLSTGLRRAKRSNTEGRFGQIGFGLGVCNGEGHRLNCPRRSPRPRLRQGQHPGTGGRCHWHGLRLIFHQHVHKLLVSRRRPMMRRACLCRRLSVRWPRLLRLASTPGCRFWAPPHTLGGNSLSGAASLPGRWLRGRCSVNVHPLHLRAAALQCRVVLQTRPDLQTAAQR